MARFHSGVPVPDGAWGWYVNYHDVSPYETILASDAALGDFSTVAARAAWRLLRAENFRLLWEGEGDAPTGSGEAPAPASDAPLPDSVQSHVDAICTDLRAGKVRPKQREAVRDALQDAAVGSITSRR